MELLDCHERLAAMGPEERAELCDLDAVLCVENATAEEAADCWPAVVLAGIVCLNRLSGIDHQHDLREAVRDVAYYGQDGMIDPAQWRAETLRVIQELMSWGDSAEFHAAAASLN